MRIRNLGTIVVVCAAAILLGAAAQASAAEPAEEIGSPFDSRIGWFYGCLAIKNPTLEPGTPVTLMIFDPDRTEFVAYGTYTHRVSGRIVGKTRSGERCEPLDAVYGPRNDGPDLSFYEVSLEGVWAPELTDGVAILGLEAETDNIDLNGDGAEDSFTLCHTGEGFRFEMWAGEARKSERLWRGTLHFGGRDTSGNCETGPIFVPVLGPYDPQVGYVDECLAIKNGELEPGTPVTIMTIEEGDAFLTDRILSLRVTGEIVGKTTSDEDCPPLFDNRSGVNDSDGVSFYTIALDDGPFMDPDETIFGIGIVGLGPENSDPIDLDGNGTADGFTACKFYEGFEFVVWMGMPYEGAPLWDAYYYLGYETEEIECPISQPEGPDLSGPPRGWDPIFRVGWLLRGCFGIDNTQLEPETPIGIMILDREAGGENNNAVFKKRFAGKILGKTESGENCLALGADIREWNERRGFAFYTVALEDGESLQADVLGIGVVHPEPQEEPFDLDGNGAADGLSVCNGRFGLTFAVWIGEPLGSDAIGSKVPSGYAFASQLTWTGAIELGGKLGGVPDCPYDL